MKKLIILIVLAVLCIGILFAQSSDYLLSLFVRQRLVMSPDNDTSTQSAEIYFEAGTADQGEYIYSSADGQLDVVAATEFQVAATTIDLNGTVDISGNLVNNSSSTIAPWEQNMLDASARFTYFEDFIGVPLDSAGSTAATTAQNSTNATLGGWKHAGDAGWTLTQAAGSYGGILRVTHVTGSNNEHYMQLGELGTETFIEADSGSSKPFYAEFRFASTDITSSAGNFFVGLAEEGCAAANFINDSGADIADKDVIGFVQWEANEDTVQVLYQTAGGAFVDTFQTVITTAQTLWAIYFDGASTLTFYKNGTSIGSLAINVTAMPKGEELSPIVATKGGAQDRVVDVDYIRLTGTR